MKLKFYVLLLTLISFSITSKAFSTPPDSTSTLVDRTAATFIIEEGKTAFFKGQTKQALTKFRQAFVKDEFNAKAALWISRCHYKLNNYGYSLQYAKEAMVLDKDVDADVYYIIGESYHRKMFLDSAKMFYNKALSNMSKSRAKVLRVEEKLVECETADSLSKISTKYSKELIKGKLNSGYNEYSPLLSADGKHFYFVSRRNDTKGGGINPDDQTYYEDTYKCTWNEELGEWDSITNNIERLNSNGFDALNYISPDGLTAYITLNNTTIDVKKQTKSSDICVLELSNKNKWGSPKAISNKSINTSFFDGAATLTADGNFMYFVSDRKGEKSKTDIYVVEKNGKRWGEAKQLPMNVNTKDNETTPYITEDGQFLFFSSNGLNGMGGYDVYVTENLGDGTWSNPINLGADFNTVNDDTHFKYYKNRNVGYIASFRLQNRKSSIDIYQMDLTGFVIPKK